MIKHTERLPIEYANGRVIEIRKPSIEAHEEIKATFDLLCKELEQDKYKHITMTQAYGSESLYRHYVDYIFSLVGVEAKELTPETLFNLLFPHQNEDESVERYGDLIKFVFGEHEGESHVPKEDVDTYAQVVGQLFAILNSYSETLKIINDLSYEDLVKVMEQRAETLKSPEQKAKDRAAKNAKEALKKLKLNPGQLKVAQEVDIDSLF